MRFPYLGTARLNVLLGLQAKRRSVQRAEDHRRIPVTTIDPLGDVAQAPAARSGAAPSSTLTRPGWR